MNKFIFFNQRLTDKLNEIYKHPFTFVCGSTGVGKTFAIHNYFDVTKAQVMWHVTKEKEFKEFFREFIDVFATCCESIKNVESILENVNNPSDIAVSVASVLKQTRFERMVYILEYKGDLLPNETFEFLYFLSNQRIQGLYIVLSVKNGTNYQNTGYLDFNINYIPEEYFLLTVKEVSDAFLKNGIVLGLEESWWLYLLSGGWIPILSAFFEEMKTRGKIEAYKSIENIAKHFFSICENGNPFGMRFIETENVFSDIVRLNKVSTHIEQYDLDGAHFALADEELKAEKYSEEGDICVYYRAGLLSLEGKANKAIEFLEKEFALRVEKEIWVSAYRILIFALQLRVLLQDKWYDEEREIIGHFFNMSISHDYGLSKRTIGFILFLEKEYHKMIALLETDDYKKKEDQPYVEFLLAAAYKEIGYPDKMKEHLSLGCKTVTETQCLLPALIFFGIFPTSIKLENQEFKKKLAKFRRAEKMNNDGHFANSKKALTIRENEIVDYVRKGMTNKEIASELNISENTVKAVLKTVFRKLGISNRKELI